MRNIFRLRRKKKRIEYVELKNEFWYLDLMLSIYLHIMMIFFWSERFIYLEILILILTNSLSLKLKNYFRKWEKRSDVNIYFLDGKGNKINLNNRILLFCYHQIINLLF